MHQSIKTLQESGIPVHSFVAAIQYLNDNTPLTDEQYIESISELIEGHNVLQLGDKEHMPRYTYLYFVQELIRESFSTDKLDTFDIFSVAMEKARVYIKDNSWAFAVAEEDGEPKLDAAGNIKPKKGAKKELAKKVYAEDIEGKELSRKEAIGILMEKVGMTSGGASTYYANLKAGRL